jgi:hypothetical protein
MNQPITQASRCRSCSQPIFWLNNATTGKRAPIDVATYIDGNVAIDLQAGTWTVVPMGQRIWLVPLHKNHFATCSSASRWEK